MTKEDDNLFVHINNKSNPDKNTYVRGVLRKIGRDDTTGISKTGIIKMMNVGIPELLIRDITTCESKVIVDCKKRVNDYKEDFGLINQFINKKFDSIHEEGPYIT